MQRLSDSRLAATLALGAVVTLATSPAPGQLANEPGLLGSSAPGLLDAGAMRPQRDLGAGQLSFEMPVGGYPPGFGAGTTGFISTGGPRRKQRGRPQPGVPTTKFGVPQPKPSVVTPNVPTGSPGQRLLPQLVRRGAPVIDLPPNLTLPPALVIPPRQAVFDPAPFDALGLREGVFLIRPAVELTGGFDSNPERIPGGKGSAEVLIAPELVVRSNWEQHALNADIHGTYLAYSETFPVSPISLDRPTLDARVAGRIDATPYDQFNVETRMLVGTDYPGSPNIQAGLNRLPIVTTIGATVGYVHDFNRLEISVKGTVDRSMWQPSSLTDGMSDSNDDRNYDQYGAILRGSYDLMPGIKPFLEVSVDTRVHDILIDRTGADRNSNGQTVRAGTTLNFNGRLTGEFSIGETQRVFVDKTLPNISGPTVDASLIYAATPLTTLKATAATVTGELVLPGSSGVLRRDYIFEVDHDFRRWLTGAVKLGYGTDTYFGLDRFDNRYVAGASLTYRLSRNLSVKGEYRHEWLRSSDLTANYNADIALLTVRLQD